MVLRLLRSKLLQCSSKFGSNKLIHIISHLIHQGYLQMVEISKQVPRPYNLRLSASSPMTQFHSQCLQTTTQFTFCKVYTIQILTTILVLLQLLQLKSAVQE